MTGFHLNPSAAGLEYTRIANPAIHPVGAENGDLASRHSYEYRHLVPVRTTGGRRPLFCIFPGPPGSAEFADLLPAEQPLYDFYFTKLDGASNFPAVEQLARMFLEQLREIQAHGPYQLCGYSKAGLVAYEMARLLSQEGEDVSFLVLFETWHPGYEKHLTRSELVRFRVLYFMDRLAKYRRNLFQGQFLDAVYIASKGISKRMKLAGWRIVRRFFGTASHPIPKSLQQAESIVVLKSFVPKPYPKRFVLIRTDDPFERKLKDPTFGWHVCATEGVDVHFVPGDQDHGTMMNKPHVRGVINKIIPYLADPRGL